MNCVLAKGTSSLASPRFDEPNPTERRFRKQRTMADRKVIADPDVVAPVEQVRDDRAFQVVCPADGQGGHLTTSHAPYVSIRSP